MQAFISVQGTPIPQGSKSAFQRGGKIVLVESGGNKHKNWRKEVNEKGVAWRTENGGDPFDGPLAVDMSFYLPKPASKPAWKNWCDVKPDLDKLVRAILDGLTGKDNVMGNDSRVVVLSATKQYALDREPGVEIRVVEINESKETPTPMDAKLFELDGDNHD